MDGTPVAVEMNAGLALDMPLIKEVGASGVGLFRTELQFLIGKQLPSIREQTASYREVIEAAKGARVVFRTADIGSDKRADYMRGPLEANPAMGWRGLRMAMDREGLLRMQLRALITAAAGGPLSILLPLVTTPREFAQARELIDKEIARTERLGEPMPSKLEVGAMIEIPSAAWCTGELARQADFLSVGGNDLAQFFFAADRESEMVSGRYDYISRGFLSFLRHIARSAQKEGTMLSYCGEQGADPLMAICLLAIGFRRLSVPASAVLPTKRMVGRVNLAEVEQALDELLQDGRASILRQDIVALAERLDIPTVRFV
jgi:phosphotransferase system enzyme I (PtsP)